MRATHPVNAVAEAIKASLRSVSDVNAVFMSTEEKADALRSLVEAERQVTALRLRVMAVGADVAASRGDKDIGAWLARECRIRRSDAATDLKLATAMDRDYPALAVSVRDGQVGPEQALVIMRALDNLSRERITQETIAAAETALVDLASRFGPAELKKLGDRILTVVDPDTAEAAEERALRESERHASERQRLSLRAVGDGTTRISGIVPDHVAVRFTTYLHAFTNPRLVSATAGDNSRSATNHSAPHISPGARTAHPKKLAEAFAQFLETVDPARLPVHGGTATTMVVTIDFEALKSGVGRADFHNGLAGDGQSSLTAGEARRLACNARLLPAVLGGKSELLDLGRARRLHSSAQRIALGLRDKTCRAEGCTIPGAWTEAHHLTPWAQGGHTTVEDAALLCSHHHHRAHDPTYDSRVLASGDIRFHRRQ